MSTACKSCFFNAFSNATYSLNFLLLLSYVRLVASIWFPVIPLRSGTIGFVGTVNAAGETVA